MSAGRIPLSRASQYERSQAACSALTAENSSLKEQLRKLEQGRQLETSEKQKEEGKMSEKERARMEKQLDSMSAEM